MSEESSVQNSLLFYLWHVDTALWTERRCIESKQAVHRCIDALRASPDPDIEIILRELGTADSILSACTNGADPEWMARRGEALNWLRMGIKVIHESLPVHLERPA